jgi:2-polyprenyl-6-methoxyphenol hydroxylase-like FAD-dependent oxidoreductase
MHPVTAHGFNLGLRSQATLAGEIKTALTLGTDIAGARVLNNYQSEHRRVTRPLYLATNAIVGLFTNEAPPNKLIRKLVLRLGNSFPSVKRMVTQGLAETDTRASLFRSLLPRPR